MWLVVPYLSGQSREWGRGEVEQGWNLASWDILRDGTLDPETSSLGQWLRVFLWSCLTITAWCWNEVHYSFCMAFCSIDSINFWKSGFLSHFKGLLSKLGRLYLATILLWPWVKCLLKKHSESASNWLTEQHYVAVILCLWNESVYQSICEIKNWH